MQRDSGNDGSRLSSRGRLTIFVPSRWLKWAALGTVALAVLASGQAIRTETAGAELEQRLTQLREQGEPIALSELVPVSIPDEANAASCYKQAFETLTFTERSGILGTYISPGAGQDQRAVLEPRVRELIRQNKEVFPLVKEATERRECLFPVDLQAVTGADWSHLEGLEKVLRLLAARAMIEAQDGDTDAAVDGVLTSLKVARATDADPLGFSFIAGLTNRYIAIWCLHDVSRSRSLTFEQAKALFDELAQSSIVPAFKRCVRGQRALYNYYFTLLRGGRENLPTPPTGSGRSNPAISKIYMLAGSIQAARIYSDQISYLDLYSTELKLIDEPYSETVKARQATKGLESYAFTWWGPFFDIVSAFHASADISGTQTAMALKAYRSRFGQYPDDLEEVESRLGWKLPLDPYTRLPFRYRREGRGFVVYSCGPNMKDDGGVIDWEVSRSGAGDLICKWDE